MDLYWKTLGGTLVAVILGLALEKQGKDFSLLITVAISAMIAAIAAGFLEAVTGLLGRLELLGDLNGTMLAELLKILGIGLTGEIAASVCTDAGNTSAAKGIRFLSNAAIAYLSVPIYTSLLELIEQIMGSV